MYLLVSPRLAKSFAMDYTFGGRRKSFVIGRFGYDPACQIRVAQARELFLEARRQLGRGVDPSAERKRRRGTAKPASVQTFSNAAGAWLAEGKKRWRPATWAQVERCLTKDVLPRVGRIPLDAVTSKDLADVLRAIHRRGAEGLWKKARTWITAIFKTARIQGRTQNHPDADLTVLVLPHSLQACSQFTLEQFCALVRALDAARCSSVVGTAAWLLIWTVQPPGRVRTLRWGDIDWDRQLWISLVDKPGAPRHGHRATPLPRQAVEALTRLRGADKYMGYVFSNRNDPQKPLSRTSVNRLFARIGFSGLSVRDFRKAMAGGLLQLGYRRDELEHACRGPRRQNTKRAAAASLARRREVLQGWADVVDGLRSR